MVNGTPEQNGLIRRAQRLQALISQDGWLDLVKMLQEIEAGALAELDKYKGADEKEIAKLVIVWKTAKHQSEYIVETVRHRIQMGMDTLKELRNPPAPVPEKNEPESNGVLPMCVLAERQQS